MFGLSLIEVPAPSALFLTKNDYDTLELTIIAHLIAQKLSLSRGDFEYDNSNHIAEDNFSGEVRLYMHLTVLVFDIQIKVLENQHNQ